jgi:L-cysteine desulfidase
MKVNENTSVAMPIKNMVGIIIAISMGIFAYTEITARLTSLETSRELMNADLLKASEQTTVDKEQFLLLEDLYETVEKHQELLDKNIHNQVMLQHIEKMLDAALEDIEKLKDKVRENGKSY